jgi:hypothetical protein
MTKIVDNLPNGKRLVPPNDSELVESVYNIGIYRLDQDACEVDTEYSHTCLYIKYCSGDYCDTVLEDPAFQALYEYISGMLASTINEIDTGKIEKRIEEDLFEIIKKYDETFDKHIDCKCPAAEPNGVPDEKIEDVVMIWCKYVLERGPNVSRS